MAEIGAAAASGPDSARLLSARYTRWLLFVLLLVSTFNYTDRFIFSLLAEAIKRDLALSDLQLGLLGGLAFALFHAVMGIPLARLADRKSRINLLAISVFFWSLATALCGTAVNFWQMLLCRVGVGVGEASFTPAVNSLIGDHFKPTRRASAISIIQLGSPISALVGAAVVSSIVIYWDWRVAFLAAGIPGIVIALLVKFGLKEPPRGLADGMPEAKGAHPSFGAVLRSILARPAAIHVIIAGSLAHIGLTGIGQFLSPFYIRVHSLSLHEAALMFGFMQAGAATIGLLLAGFGSDWAATRDRRWHAWWPALSLALAGPLFAAAFLQENLLPAALLIFPGSIALFVYLVPTYAMLQNMMEARMRASAIAVYALIGSMAGALGPALYGLLSDILARQRFALGDFDALCPGGVGAPGTIYAEACRGAAAGGLQIALACGMIVFAWSALHFLLAARTLRKDSVS
ncbi:spinster family MFS transporter [Parasphingopyxis marina]|uniref:MFS transporter n=1 Tax=Parasphingopyxis marina TaxID=2761622 RepID=A0A842HZU4_9SPHN|nr:MFS transporter [Parasphingopyxis marina]MBC2777024.1 MFS transporter [Parasphingopyxis marina]